MKATKFVVGIGAVIGIAACFMDWASIELEGLVEKVAGGDFPTAGMDQGGPVFIFLLSLPLIAAVVGGIKRMGRGMGVLALVGGLLSTFMALVKYADIQDAAALLGEAGAGSVSVTGGFWLLFAGSLVATVGGLVALIKPEPKPQSASSSPTAPVAA